MPAYGGGTTSSKGECYPWFNQGKCVRDNDCLYHVSAFSRAHSTADDMNGKDARQAVAEHAGRGQMMGAYMCGLQAHEATTGAQVRTAIEPLRSTVPGCLCLCLTCTGFVHGSPMVEGGLVGLCNDDSEVLSLSCALDFARFPAIRWSGRATPTRGGRIQLNVRGFACCSALCVELKRLGRHTVKSQGFTEDLYQRIDY